MRFENRCVYACATIVLDRQCRPDTPNKPTQHVDELKSAESPYFCAIRLSSRPFSPRFHPFGRFWPRRRRLIPRQSLQKHH